MKAVRIHSYGDGDVLAYEDAPEPELGDGDILIQVHASSVNPFDWKVRRGYLAGYFNHQLPLTLGWDVSGVVMQVGANSNGYVVGDKVFAQADVTRNGAYAEYIAVTAGRAAYKPESIDHDAAAAIPNAALAAWNALVDVGGLSAGQHVLIHAAAGGVGTFAVQIAKWLGAEVTGTASAANREFLHALGADHVIDYSTQRFEDHVSGVDLVLDSVGGDTLQRSWITLKPGGILTSIVETPDQEAAARSGVKAAMAVATGGCERLTRLANLVDEGHIRPIVSTIYPLHEIRHGHAQSEGFHTRGKIALHVRDT